ncbi:MAG TPA: hypothetical protein VEA60_10145, partial [Allosphingosinicella sp.]|nr:hypothetical protein [Allosphingosinicella sp.]
MRSCLLALLLLLLFASPALAAEADEKRAVLAVVQDFFDALKAKEEDRVTALVVAEGTISGHDARGSETGFFAGRWQDWAKGLPGAKPALAER